MKTTKKSFENPSAKPVDVEYRIKRLNQTLAEAAMFLFAIDPSVFPEQFEEVKNALRAVRNAAGVLKAPAKKPRGKKAAEPKAEAA